VSGPLKIVDKVKDARFKVSAPGHPILCRNVEVFQWEEKQVKFEETRGNMKRTGTRFEYHCHWMPGKEYKDS